MTRLIPLRIWLHNHLWIVAVFIVLAYLLLVLYQKMTSRRQPDKPKFPAALVLLLLPLLYVFSFINDSQEISDINRIDGINYSPAMNKVTALIRYNKVNNSTEEAVISVSLDDQKNGLLLFTGWF